MAAAPADESYRAFRARNAKGVLYRLSSMDDPLRARVQVYVHGGAMDADLRYARELYGLTNTSGRKEFELFWESPWAEEHARDAPRKRRKRDAQHLAVRSYIRASTAAGPPAETASFLDTVDKLTEWEDDNVDAAREVVKTVSRLVQSHEHAALASLGALAESPACASYRGALRAYFRLSAAGDADAPLTTEALACTLRRSAAVYPQFAAVVAAELIWAEATNGTRNTTIYMCRQLDDKRATAAMALLRVLAGVRELPPDTVGLPLMSVRCSLCVTRGVLVVMPGSVSATYVLDLLPTEDVGGDLSQIKMIQIARVVAAERVVA